MGAPDRRALCNTAIVEPGRRETIAPPQFRLLRHGSACRARQVSRRPARDACGVTDAGLGDAIEWPSDSDSSRSAGECF
jgi:hypothetical protein